MIINYNFKLIFSQKMFIFSDDTKTVQCVKHSMHNYILILLLQRIVFLMLTDHTQVRTPS